MSGSGVYSSESRLRSQVVVGKLRVASISKNAGAGRNPLTGVELHPVLGARRALIGREVGQAIVLEADDLEAIEIFARRVLFKLRQHAAHQLRPHCVLLGGIGGVVLLDDVRRGGGKQSR